MKTSRRAIDTDRLVLGAAVRRELADVTIDGACRVYARQYIQVEERGTRNRVIVSAPRVAFALANPTTHVGADEIVVHVDTCGYAPTTGDQPCCVEPTHLQKGDRATAAIASYLRKAAKP